MHRGECLGAGCRLCWLYEHDARYRALWDGGPCAFLGQPTGDEVPCGTCPGSVRLKLFVCGVHGKCTVGKSVPGVKSCRCKDYVPGG